MSDHYQVKFNQNGVMYFGIVEDSEKAEVAAHQGNVIVADAILPKDYLVPESEIIDLEMGEYEQVQDPDTGLFHMECTGEYEQYVKQEHRIAVEHSQQVGNGLKVGKLFQVGVGDGYAYYIVTKVNKKTVKVEWRGFSADRWVDRWLGYGGSFPRHQIEPWITGQERLDEFFSKEA